MSPIPQLHIPLYYNVTNDVPNFSLQPLHYNVPNHFTMSAQLLFYVRHPSLYYFSTHPWHHPRHPTPVPNPGTTQPGVLSAGLELSRYHIPSSHPLMSWQ